MEVTPPTVPDEPILVVQWERTLAMILDRTAQFPKSERHTFAARVDGRALDVLEVLVQARWASRREKGALLAIADTHLALQLNFNRDRKTPALQGRAGRVRHLHRRAKVEAEVHIGRVPCADDL